MKRKKTVIYAGAIVLIMAAGILMQYGIRWSSGFFSGQIRDKFSRPPEIMTETAGSEEEGRFILAMAGETEIEAPATSTGTGGFPGENEITVSAGQNMDEDAAAEASHIAQTRATLDGLTAYHNANTPEVTGDKSDLQAFVGDRNQNFVNAVLNFLYAYYRDRYLVQEIHLLEKVEEKDGILTYRMELYLSQGRNNGYTVFLCSYDTKEDVYTIFNIRNAVGK